MKPLPRSGRKRIAFILATLLVMAACGGGTSSGKLSADQVSQDQPESWDADRLVALITDGEQPTYTSSWFPFVPDLCDRIPSEREEELTWFDVGYEESLGLGCRYSGKELSQQLSISLDTSAPHLDNTRFGCDANTPIGWIDCNEEAANELGDANERLHPQLLLVRSAFFDSYYAATGDWLITVSVSVDTEYEPARIFEVIGEFRSILLAPPDERLDAQGPANPADPVEVLNVIPVTVIRDSSPISCILEPTGGGVVSMGRLRLQLPSWWDTVDPARPFGFTGNDVLDSLLPKARSNPQGTLKAAVLFEEGDIDAGITGQILLESGDSLLSGCVLAASAASHAEGDFQAVYFAYLTGNMYAESGYPDVAAGWYGWASLNPGGDSQSLYYAEKASEALDTLP